MFNQNYGIIGLLILALDIYAILHVAGSGTTPGKKVLWILGIVVFPFIGAVIWWLAGPRSEKL